MPASPPLTPTAPSTTARHPIRDVADGAIAMSPIVVGYVPFALTVGASAGETGPWLPRWLGTFLIYGGTAQLAVLRSLDDGAGVIVVILAGLLTQSRLFAYSSAFASSWHDESSRFRLAAVAVIVEPTWALGTARYAATTDRAAARRYYIGAGAALTLGWGALVTVGMLTGGAGVPGLLTLAVPLSLVAVIAPQVTSRSNVVVVVVAVCTMLASGDLPSGTGLLAAMVAGAVAGYLTGVSS